MTKTSDTLACVQTFTTNVSHEALSLSRDLISDQVECYQRKDRSPPKKAAPCFKKFRIFAMSTLQEKSSPAFLWEHQGPVRGLRGELRSFGGGRELAQGFQASSKKTEFFISRYEVLC